MVVVKRSDAERRESEQIGTKETTTSAHSHLSQICPRKPPHAQELEHKGDCYTVLKQRFWKETINPHKRARECVEGIGANEIAAQVGVPRPPGSTSGKHALGLQDKGYFLMQEVAREPQVTPKQHHWQQRQRQG